MLNLSAAMMLMALAPMAAAAPPDHVVIVIEENHNYNQIIGSPSAPYINQLASQGALLTNMLAITHPSQPNYVNFFAGSFNGVFDNNVPALAPFTAPNMGANLLAAGRTFVGYGDGLPAAGSLVATFNAYARKHNPWTHWQADPPGLNQLSSATNLPFTSFPSDFSQLPTVAMVVPDLNNDMHDGSVAQADSWLQTNLGAYALWAQTHNSLLIVVWDEDGFSERNHIPCIFYGPMVRPGTIASVHTLHGLLRTIEDLYSTPHAGNAALTTPIAGVFKSDPPTTSVSFRQGASAYVGCHTTYVDSAAPTSTHATDAIIQCDGSPVQQGLIRFDEIFGTGAGQIPPAARIVSAKLLLLCGSATSDSSIDTFRVHRMLVPWSDSSTWNSMVGGGISTNGIEADAVPDFPVIPNTTNTWQAFDVTRSLKLWQLNPSTNFGHAIIPSGTDGFRFASATSTLVDDRPMLEVSFWLKCSLADVAQLGGALGPDGQHTPDDLLVFLNEFFTGGFATADVATIGGAAGADGQLSVDDFIVFLGAFFAPCN